MLRLVGCGEGNGKGKEGKQGKGASKARDAEKALGMLIFVVAVFILGQIFYKIIKIYLLSLKIIKKYHSL